MGRTWGEPGGYPEGNPWETLGEPGGNLRETRGNPGKNIGGSMEGNMGGIHWGEPKEPRGNLW